MCYLRHTCIGSISYCLTVAGPGQTLLYLQSCCVPLRNRSIYLLHVVLLLLVEPENQVTGDRRVLILCTCAGLVSEGKQLKV